MMRRLIAWFTALEGLARGLQASSGTRKRRHEKKLRAMGVSRSEAKRIASARFGNERR